MAQPTDRPTRGFLIADGKLAGERVAFIVNHWPSRGAESPARERAGMQVRALKDSLQRLDSKIKIVIMGDMNDDPMDKSMQKPQRTHFMFSQPPCFFIFFCQKSFMSVSSFSD